MVLPVSLNKHLDDGPASCGGFASESLHENLIRSSRRLKSNGHTDGLAGESLRIERDGLVGKSLHEDMRRTT